MNAKAEFSPLALLLAGLRGESHGEPAENPTRHAMVYTLIVLVGAGIYGAVVGSWRSPLQSLYVAVKLPVVLLLTACANALLNALLAMAQGLNLGLRESFNAILMSFAMASVILASFSPVLFFFLRTLRLTQESDFAYSVLLLSLVAVIAFSGAVANLRLLGLLKTISGNSRVAQRTMFAWLAGNLFLGAQLCWISRPFIGSPSLPVEFFRSDALKGNFYEAVFHSLQRLF